MKRLIVWYNPNKNVYYYKVVRGIYYERYDYVVGSVNNYGHVIVLVVDLKELLPTSYVSLYRSGLKHHVVSSLISLLKKID